MNKLALCLLLAAPLFADDPAHGTYDVATNTIAINVTATAAKFNVARATLTLGPPRSITRDQSGIETSFAVIAGQSFLPIVGDIWRVPLAPPPMCAPGSTFDLAPVRITIRDDTNDAHRGSYPCSLATKCAVLWDAVPIGGKGLKCDEVMGAWRKRRAVRP